MNFTNFPHASTLKIRGWCYQLRLLFCLLLVISVFAWCDATPLEAATKQGVKHRSHRSSTVKPAARKRHQPQPKVAKEKSLTKRESRERVAQDGEEDVNGRLNWFLYQRTYPFNSIPADARRGAFEDTVKRLKGRFGTLAGGVASWQSVGPRPSTSASMNVGIISGRINAIAVSPTDPNLILIGGATGGIWRSTDGGANFTPVSDNQADLAVGSITFSRSNPSIVYAGMGDPRGGGGEAYLGSGVLKSTNGGQTWTRVSNNTLPTPATNSKLEVDPTNADRVYVAQRHQLGTDRERSSGGFFLSTDGGVSWRMTLRGAARDLVLNAANPQTLYLAMSALDTGNAGDVPGLYRSTDGGGTWTLIYTSPYGSRTSDIKVAVSAANPQTIYVYPGRSGEVRIVVSTDGGATWTDRGGAGLDAGQFGYNTFLFVDPANANTVYVGARDVYKSTDGGVSWINLTKNFTLVDGNLEFVESNALSHVDQHTLAFAPNNSNTFYIGNDGGISRTSDGGMTFQSLNSTLSLTQFEGLAIHPTNPAITYGGTQDNGTQRRLPNSTTWNEFSGGDGGRTVINPLDPSIVFPTNEYGSISRYRNNGQEQDKQIATNTTFGEPRSNPRISFYAPFVSNGVDATLYFGTWRLFISTDLGETWNAPAGMTDLTKGGTDVLSAVGVGRNNTSVIYTGSRDGRVMVSTNGGQNFTDITAGLPNRSITSITVDSRNADTAFVTFSGFRTTHVFKTTNRGAAWTDISGALGASGSLPDIPVNALLLDPINPTTLYVGTDIGVFRSTAGGTTWESFNNGLPPVIVNFFAAQASGLIQTATYGRGVYELSGAAATPTPTPVTIQFGAANYSVREDAGSVTITVTRSGGSSGTASVDYTTVDNPAIVACSDTRTKPGVAFARCDYATSVDTLTFAAGETQKTFTIPIINDVHVEGDETFQLTLSNIVGATSGTPPQATVTITDNDTAPATTNPIDQNMFFVRQQYLDFLSREPEAGEPWTGVLNRCPNVNNDPNCDRIEVSSSFFRSPEFQLKGYFVYRFYRVAFNRRPRYDEIILDLRRVTGATGEEVNAKRRAFTDAFAQREEFRSLYGAKSPGAFVDDLLRLYGVNSITTIDPANPDGTAKVTLTHDKLVSLLEQREGQSPLLTRAQVLRAVVQSDEVDRVEYNGAFVAIQYYGYLRREPEQSGYDAWLRVIDRFPRDDRQGYRVMVDGFMNSAEYRQRFGPPQ